MPDDDAWPDPLTIDPATLDCAVLQRLIAEVQQEAVDEEQTPGNDAL